SSWPHPAARTRASAATARHTEGLVNLTPASLPCVAGVSAGRAAHRGTGSIAGAAALEQRGLAAVRAVPFCSLPRQGGGRNKDATSGGPVRVPSLVLLFLARIATIRGPSAGRDHGRFRPTGWEGESKRAWLAICAGPSLVPSSSWSSSSRSSTT